MRRLETQRTSFLDVLQTLGAFVAIPVALLYPVGFFALFAQFTNYFFLDFYTGWYAASLVNRMVAIEQGATILVLALVASVVLSAIIAQIFLTHAKSRVPSGFERRRSLGKPSTVGAKLKALFARLKAAFTLSRYERRGVLCAKLLGLFLPSLILYIVYSRMLAGGRVSWFVLRGRQSTECNQEKVRWYQLNLWPDSLVPAFVFLAGCLIGGWLIHRSYRTYRQRTYANRGSYLAARRRLPSVSNGVTEGWLLKGLLVAYAFSVFASIALAWFTPAFVPFMTYGDTVVHRGEPQPTENAFLSHTEGHWYFVRRIQNDYVDDPYRWSRPDYIIVSVAEREVKHVQVRPNPPRASRVEPLPFGLGEEPLEKDPCKSTNVMMV